MSKFGELLDEKIPILLVFYRQEDVELELHPILKDVAAAIGDKGKVIKIEVDKNHKLSEALRVKILPTLNNKSKLIKYYDDHNIFILPSFTEGHPMVLLEALARRRPVVIFDEIKHVIGDKKGVFVSKRNFLSFLSTLNTIKKNYKKIQKDMKKNKLPTNKEFIDKFIKYIDDFN